MKRRSLSVNITPEAHAALLRRVAEEGHRYPAVLAATLLERALLGPAGTVESIRPDGAVMVRTNGAPQGGGALDGAWTTGPMMTKPAPRPTPQRGGGPTRPSEPLHLTTCGTAYRGCDPACPLDRKRREEELDEARGGAG